jgi:hypothetical protein
VRDGRGATLVEVAIVTPLLMLLVFGIIEFGLAYFDNQSINHGVREAARHGIVLDFEGGVGACASESSDGNKLACQAGHLIDIDGIGVRVIGGGSEIGDPLTVCAAVAYDALTGYLNPFLNNRVLDSSVTMRLEQEATGSLSGTWGDSSNIPAAGDC